MAETLPFALRLLTFLEENVDSDGEYINPHLLQEMATALRDYTGAESEKLDNEIIEMFER